MKKIVLLTIFLLINSSFILAQVAINNDNSDPDNSAMLHVKSTTKGFLPPQMTTVQRDAISTPAEGLTIYNLDLKCLEFYTGSVNGWYSPCLGMGTINCSGVFVNGSYMAGIALASYNTVSLSVTNSTTGGYTISTNTVNGFRFSKTGTFTTIGSQVVVLTGTGMPVATGTTTFTVTYGNSTCTFTVTVINPMGEPCAGTPTVTHGGKTYSTVQIGNQCWLKENLNIGTRINGSLEQTDNGILEKYCYEDLESNCDIYGGLYQWEEVLQYETTPGVQGICPQGWHLPTSTELTALQMFLGDDSAACGKLKESGYSHWLSPNNGATNESGFTGLPGGNRCAPGCAYGLGFLAFFWSSSEHSDTYADVGALSSENNNTFLSDYEKISGFSARCVKNAGVSNLNAPIPGTNNPSQTQIIWNWTTVTGATGYKWNTADDYATATDMGTDTAWTESGLTCNHACTRYVWAYSSCGLSPVTTLSQTTLACTAPAGPCPGMPTVTYSGKVYNTVQIGDQCWLKENLNIGTRINLAQTQTNNSVIEKYCYDNLEANCDVYGGLYQWDEVMQYVTTQGTQGLCPTGWHVPMDQDLLNLHYFLGPMGTEGGKMKESGYSHWQSPNSGATNESGFTALPGGFSINNGSNSGIGTYARFWTSSETSLSESWNHRLQHNGTFTARYTYTKLNGASIRCLKNTCTSSPNTPASGIHFGSPTIIDWHWGSASGAIGYKWNTTNNYATSIEIGNHTYYQETGLIPGTSYTRYVWAYNECGISPEITLTSQTTTFAIGDYFEGGIIFYIDPSGQHGLIAAESDQSEGAAWGCDYIPIVTSTAIFTGQTNTDAILNSCTTAGDAARTCEILILNGYDDWFLPSKDELNQMYLQKSVIGNFTDGNYWSSSQYSTSNAFFQLFTDGSQANANKNATYRVRAVRDF